MAYGYLLLYKRTKENTYKEKAMQCLDWLEHHKAPGYRKYSWGNHFDFASRSGGYSAHEPIIVWTSLIGQAFLEAYEQLHIDQFLDIAESICEWIMDLPREHTPTGTCLSYMAIGQYSVHNANMLGAAMLARTAKHVGNSSYVDVAKSAMQYSCARQFPEGSWWYGEAPMYHWIDNFHTGYNLSSLKCYIDSTGDTTYVENISRGLQFFKTHFFEDNGKPKYYHDRLYPVDIQCASQAIETLAYFALEDRSSLDLGKKVAKWTIENMQDKKGFFYYRHYPMMKAKIPMLHWGQATMYKALAFLLHQLQ
jgi:rhamnogalacturonyl hydrolase YesR